MKCPKCEGVTRVTTTYQNKGNTTRRRRECTVCTYRFTTRESAEGAVETVVDERQMTLEVGEEDGNPV